MKQRSESAAGSGGHGTVGGEVSVWTRRLLEAGEAVRQRVRGAGMSVASMATPVARQGGDVLFAIDREVEAVLNATISAWETACWVVAEGLGEDGRRRYDGAASQTPCRLLIDPIDGTRGLMYDKRSAWFIAAVAVDRGEATRLRDTFASVLVELPTTLQGWARTFYLDEAGRTRGDRQHLETGDRREEMVRPSEAVSLREGFAQVSNFFPGTKRLASELMERIAEATLGEVQPGEAAVYDDQYLSTAGQMVELMVGHDRFCCDVRPLLTCAAGGTPGLACHPYDLAALQLAERAGVILTDGFGGPLDGPMDVHTPMHWCGYANAQLHAAIEPVIRSFWRDHGVTPQKLASA